MMPDPSVDLSGITYNPQEYVIDIPENPFLPALSYPQMEIPADNPLTQDGVQLGRRLFYDPILSADSTMSCFSCHNQGLAFTDGAATSIGIDGINGTRSSMSLVDIGFNLNGFFWDGRSANLEDQALLPVEDPIELHAMWPEVVTKLQNSTFYQEWFRKAFGIENSNEITKELAAKALAQFERAMVSSNESRYDRIKRNEISFTDLELLGESLFFDDDDSVPDSECNHCHQPPLFTTNLFVNNGIENVSNLSEFPDKGLGSVTKDSLDNGKFRIPTLRNIELTAPYMHDGRFQTLEEVIEHYNSGGHFVKNIDPLMRPLGLNQEEKDALVAFLKTLTDNNFLENETFSNPF
jgi:cytochrome c peroxidase